MKRIVIVTLWGNINFGNKLQNYALKKLIEAQGDEVTIIKYNMRINILERLKELLRSIIYGKILLKKEYLNDKNRKKLIKEFSNSYVTKNIDIGNNLENIKKVNFDSYDYVITGSDQVWHGWGFDNYELDYFYLSFVPKEKRIAFSASFGFDEFPQNDKNKHINGICNMKKISCREESGAALVEKVIGNKPEVILDPTMCVPVSVWHNVMKKPDIELEYPYVCTYFLGSIPNAAEEEVKILSDKLGYKVIHIMDKSQEYYSKIGPREFLWIIANSRIVFTDSFHGSVFSILFEKNFQIFKREEKTTETMYGRINTLLSTFKLKNCEYTGQNYKNYLAEIDYSTSKVILEIKRKEALEYYMEATNCKEGH